MRLFVGLSKSIVSHWGDENLRPTGVCPGGAVEGLVSVGGTLLLCVKYPDTGCSNGENCNVSGGIRCKNSIESTPLSGMGCI